MKTYSLEINSSNEKWCGTWGAGLYKLSDTIWTIYNTSNSGIATNSSHGLELDSAENLWIANFGGGEANVFDGITWTSFDSTNSCMEFNYSHDIYRDSNNDMWIAEEGVAKYDWSTWTCFTSSNSGLPSNIVWAIAEDDNGNHWFGTDEGLVKYDGTNWIVFNVSNSPLPYNRVISLLADGNDVWFGTQGGGAGLIQDAIYVGINENHNSTNYQLFPNPMNETSYLKFDNINHHRHTLELFDIYGQTVLLKTGINNNQVEINRGNLTAGVYYFRLSNESKMVNAGKIIIQ